MSVVEHKSPPPDAPRQSTSAAGKASRPQGTALHRGALWVTRHRRAVGIAWVMLVGIVLLAGSRWAGSTSSDFTTPGAPSAQAAERLSEALGTRSPDTIDVVWADSRGVRSPEVEQRARAFLEDASAVPGIVGLDSPYVDGGGAVSEDDRTAMASLTLAGPAAGFSKASATELIALADHARAEGLDLALAGEPISAATETTNNAELIGFGVAALVLMLSFGSLLAAGLPLVTALVGFAMGVTGIGLLASVTTIPDFAPTVAAMVGIGVGIDYALLMVTRFRAELAVDGSAPDAAVRTVDSAGRSVLIAGSTVVIAVMGLLAIGSTTLNGVAYATSLFVLFVMLASLTLLPALLAGPVGVRINRVRIPLHRLRGGRQLPNQHGELPAGLVARWAAGAQRRPVLSAALAVVFLLGLAVPSFGLRLGIPDSGNDPSGTHPRRAYDMVARGFGPGANGPLLLVATSPSNGDVDAVVGRLAATLREAPGIASVEEPTRVPGASRATSIVTVIPQTSPQSDATAELVRRLRADVLPTATQGTGLEVLVGGATAANVDQSDYVAGRISWFVAGVILLSLVLLSLVFRAPVIAVKAAVMNLLSVGAAYGAVAVFASGGTLSRLIGIDTDTPVPAFIPVLMFAVLFGLSMDYEVFLLSRIRERHLLHGDTRRAITEGVGLTARVITVAALIMTAVFLAFVTDYDVFVKLAGVGLATAVVVDSTVIRLLLVPATMQLLGEANWWAPRWLKRNNAT